MRQYVFVIFVILRVSAAAVSPSVKEQHCMTETARKAGVEDAMTQ